MLIGLVWLSSSLATRVATQGAHPSFIDDVCDMLRSMTLTNMMEAAKLMENPEA